MHGLFCPFSSTSRHGPLISQKNFAKWNDRNYTSFTHLLIPATRWKWNSSKLQNCTTLPIFSRRSRDATTDIYVFDILNSLFIYLSTIYINRILLFLFIYIFINLFIVVRHPPSAVRRPPFAFHRAHPPSVSLFYRHPIISDGVVSGIRTLFSLDHKLYASDYDSDTDSVASENQP